MVSIGLPSFDEKSDEKVEERKEEKEERFELDKFLEFEKAKKIRQRAIEILNRLPRYVEGYLLDISPNLNLDVRRDFRGDPLELTIRVYLTAPKEEVYKDRHD